MKRFWALLPNSQKGMRFNTRDIWHYVEPYNAINKPRGFSCYKEHGKYYSICRVGIPIETRLLARQDNKPPYKDSCRECVRLFNKRASR
jgi:hypothetical protein